MRFCGDRSLQLTDHHQVAHAGELETAKTALCAFDFHDDAGVKFPKGVTGSSPTCAPPPAQSPEPPFGQVSVGLDASPCRRDRSRFRIDACLSDARMTNWWQWQGFLKPTEQLLR